MRIAKKRLSGVLMGEKLGEFATSGSISRTISQKQYLTTIKHI